MLEHLRKYCVRFPFLTASRAASLTAPLTPASTGIGPEYFGYFSSDGNYTGSSPSDGDIAFYEKHGFFIYPGESDYYLRPEVLESNFYAWRVTGDPKYVERAASALDSFMYYLEVPSSYAGIDDVDATDSAFIDDMQSFWFAEVLKYL